MKEQLIQEIQRKMLPYLNNEQLLQLGSVWLGFARCEYQPRRN